MNYLTFPVGHCRQGTTVEVTLQGSESDVFLVDAMNLSAFQRGGNFQYWGGHYRSSPVRLAVPHFGSWTVVVIPSGYVEAAVRVFAAA